MIQYVPIIPKNPTTRFENSFIYLFETQNQYKCILTKLDICVQTGNIPK